MPTKEEPGGGAARTGQGENHFSNKYIKTPDSCQLIIDAILEVQGGHRRSDGSYMVRCPAHDDNTPSLHITPADDGRILVNCQAGCSQGEVIAALQDLGLWPSSKSQKSTTELPPGIPPKWYGAEYIAHWTYYNKQGKALGHVARYEVSDGKQVVPFFKSRGAGWKAGAAPEPRPLYNLHKLSRDPDKPVLIVEGEKAADAAERISADAYVCMTWPGGSNAPGKADFKPLSGRDVIIWPDADDPGHKAARTVAEKCRKSGARSVTIVKPPAGVESGWDLGNAEAEGWTGEQVQETVEAAREKSGGFKFIRVADLQTNPPQWLIKRLMEKDSPVQIFGDPGCGKSLIGIDIACCVAAGLDFHGHRVEPGAALYIAGEGQNGIGRRFTAWKIRHQVDLSLLPLFLSTAPASFCDAESAAEVEKAIEATGQTPALVVVDTLARNFGPGDENSTQDMSAFIAALDQIRTRYRCTILLIHHSGHSDKTRSRGAMALRGALDVEYRMHKNEHGIVLFEYAKPPKDFEAPEPLAFEIRTVELGIMDEDGEPVASAILDSVEYEPPEKKSNTGRGKWQSTALRVLDELYNEHRRNLDAGNIDPGKARVLITDWRDRCCEAGMNRQTFYRVKNSLGKQGVIWIDGDYVGRVT